MPYLKKVTIHGKGYFYMFHTVRDGNKFKKLSKYIGKEKPSKEEIEKLKQDFIKKIKSRPPAAAIEEKRPRVNLLAILKEMQDKYGCLPEDKVRELSEETGIPVVEIYDAASFYSMFSFHKKGKKIIRVCNSPSCYINGSLNILKEIRNILKIDVNKTTLDGKFTLELTSCIGCCNEAPAIMINDRLIGNITKDKLRKLLK